MDLKTAYKFCPRCGQPTKTLKKYMHCGSCGLDTYFNPKPVQEIALRNEKGEYLFSVRAENPRKGYLDFPGGFMDVGEDFEEGIRRELMEELGIKVGKIDYIGTCIYTYTHQDIDYDLIGVLYRADLPKSAKPQPADDVAAIEFYKLSDVPLNRLSTKNHIALLKKLAEYDSKP